MADALKNFAISTVVTAPSPAASGTTLVVTTGHGTRFPATPFDVVIKPATGDAEPDNAEIATCTAIASDTLTLVRAQRGTSARTIVAGDRIFQGVTAKALEDRMENPMTTAGDLIVGGVAGAPARRGIGLPGARLGVDSDATPAWYGDDWAVVPFDVLGASLSTTGTQGTNSGSSFSGTEVGTLGGAGNTFLLQGGTAFPNGATRFWNGGNAITANRGGVRKDKIVYAEIRTRFIVPTLSDGTDTFTIMIGWGRIFTNAATAMTDFFGATIEGAALRALHRAASANTYGAASGTIIANTTHALRIIYDGTTTSVYLDGTLVSSVSTGAPGGSMASVPTFQIIKTAGAANSRQIYFGTGLAAIKYNP